MGWYQRLKQTRALTRRVFLLEADKWSKIPFEQWENLDYPAMYQVPIENEVITVEMIASKDFPDEITVMIMVDPVHYRETWLRKILWRLLPSLDSEFHLYSDGYLSKDWE